MSCGEPLQPAGPNPARLVAQELHAFLFVHDLPEAVTALSAVRL